MYVMQKIHQKDQNGLGMKSSRHKRNRFSLTGFGEIEISHHYAALNTRGIYARYFHTMWSICSCREKNDALWIPEPCDPECIECMVSSLSYTANQQEVSTSSMSLRTLAFEASNLDHSRFDHRNRQALSTVRWARGKIHPKKSSPKNGGSLYNFWWIPMGFESATKTPK